MSLDNIIFSGLTQILANDGTGFDGQQVRYPTLVEVDGTQYLYYAGLNGNNFHSIGLATSTDGVNYTRVSDDPVIDRTDAPAWASFRIYPETVMYEDGEFKMWFHGRDTNLSTDPGNTYGFGYATSTDGVNWSIVQEPIRVQDGPREGASIVEVVKLDDQYIAYYYDQNNNAPSVLYRAVSDDGIEFYDDQLVEFNDAAGSGLHSATVVGGKIIGVVSFDGAEYIATSIDGLNFDLTQTIELPSGYTDYAHDIIVDGDEITLVGQIIGPGNTIDIYTVTAQYTFEPETPLSTGFALPVGERDGVLATEDQYDEDGWYVFSDLGAPLNDAFHLGEDWNFNAAPYDANDPYDDLGQSVFAASNGKVVYAGPHYGPALNFDTAFGNLVVIEHLLADDRLIYSLYAHLDSIEPGIVAGAIVDGTDVKIGEVGETGAAGTPHLHFEVFEGNWQLAVAEIAYVDTFICEGSSHTVSYSAGQYYWQEVVDGQVVSNLIDHDAQDITWFDPTDLILGLGDFSGEPPIVIDAGNGSDTLVGGDGDDILDGGRGSDVIIGGYGDDMLSGGRGDDVIYGGGGADIISGGRGSDAIQGGNGNDLIDGGRGADIISGDAGSDYIDGGRGADILDGGFGADQINGGAGSDTIIGGADDDILVGGAGADDFVFATAFEYDPQADTILDYSSQDMIVIENYAADFSDLTISQVGTDVLIEYAPGFTITLVDYDANDLSQSDFDFS